MANAASTIEIELEIRQAINRLDRLQRELTQSTQSFNKAAQATRKFEGAINKAKAGLVAFFAAISIQKLAQLSDAMTQFENRVKLATNSLVQQLAVQQQLFQVAQKTALPLEDVGQLYSRLRIAAEQLGASQRDLINLTETVGLALKASGTSAASAQGALLQLGQALNSPRVQAEEFNSLIDGMPNLLREVEKQLGLTAGGLKKFVTDGQLSNKKFFDAILASQNALTQQANSSASTIEQANQRVANSFTSLIGAIDDKLGASKFFTGFIDGLASGIDKLSNFLGLTTQATGGGSGGANLDEIISEEAKPTPPKMPSLYFQTYVEGLAGMLNSNASKTEVKKQIIAFMDYFNQTVEQAVEEGGFSFTPYPDFDPTFKEIIPVKDFIENEYIPILQMLEGMLAAAPNLTFFEEIREELLEQIRLFTILEENAQRTTDAIVSGVSGAGPNASRATNIAQSKSIEEAAAKLILSNEKVAAAIDKSFEILFDTLDPVIDLLGDLISSINRLIGALIEGVGNAIETNLDAIGLGPNSYYGGGGFIRDIETMGGGPQGGTYQPTASEALQIAAIEDLRDIVDGQDETLNNLLDAARESGNLVGVVELFKQSINNLIPALTKDPDLQTYEQILQRAYDNMEYMPGVDTLEDYVKYYQDFIDATTGELPRAEAYVAVGTAELIIQELAERISGTGTNVSDFEGISDLVTKTAQEQIDSIHFQNLTAEEQIHFRNEETVAMLNQQKLFIQLIDDEERRADLLTKIAAAEAKQLELYNLQLSELQRLNEEREREATLLLQQQGQAQVDKLLSDLERTFDDIIELVQGLRDQASGLLLGQYSTASATDRFSTAADTYSDLLAAALDPEATEENVKDFQDFVDAYLKSAQDVFKSSSRYQNIFNSVLADIEEVANFVSIAMPINEIESVKKQLVEVAEEFGLSMEEVVEGLDRLVLALTFRALVVDVPIQTVIDEANSDLVVEAVVTAIEDSELSDTQIEAVVKAIMGAGSDTVIEAIVKAVQAPGSNTTIKAVVNAIAASSSDLQIEAVVSAVANQQLSDLQIEAIVTAVKASGSDTVIKAVVSAVEDKILSDTEIEAIVTAVKASGSNTVISAIVSAIAASGSDTQIEALVTAIAASGSDTQIEAIVKAIMASGSDTQIEAIVSAVASNTPVISAIVAAVAANTPVVTPNINLDDSNISAAFDSLSQTLENSIGSLIATIQLQGMLATATAEGIYSGSARSFTMSGAQGVISGFSVDLKPRGDFSDYQYGLAEGVQFTGALSTQDQFSALINSAESENPVIRNNPYYVLFPAAETGNTTKARLFGFTDLSKAEDFYNYYSSRTVSYINDNGTLKYGFRQGGLVPDPMDTIPAMLSPGEYILSPETVRRYGVSNLNRLNSGDTAALNATSDPEVKRLLAELIVAVRENDTEVNVYTDMAGQTKAGIEEFRSELRERTRRQGDKFLPARYI